MLILLYTALLVNTNLDDCTCIEAKKVCEDSCGPTRTLLNNDFCNDGDTSKNKPDGDHYCALGTDCSECGERVIVAIPSYPSVPPSLPSINPDFVFSIPSIVSISLSSAAVLGVVIQLVRLTLSG